MLRCIRAAFIACIAATAVFADVVVCADAVSAETQLPRFLKKLGPKDLNPAADAFGPIREDVDAVPILSAGATIGWAFLTSDFVETGGYSGKPIHIVAGIDLDAVVTGVRLVKHSEPIVLVGIPERKVVALTESYAGLDLKREAAESGSAHDLDIISGATVTVMVIDDSIVRAGLKVARALGLGGLAPPPADTGPRRTVNMAAGDIRDWQALTGDGSVRRLSLDLGQVNDAFAASGNQKAVARPERGETSETFIDLNTALVSVPGIGRSLLGAAEYENLKAILGDGDHAILVAGRGRYSFKGSGYVRGGVFDRIVLIQGDLSVRFRDRNHRRIAAVEAAGAPALSETDLFTIPASSGFDPTKPWRLQLLVQRAVGAVERAFVTFDLGYRLPESYVVTEAREPAAAPAGTARADDAGRADLWKRIWHQQKYQAVVLVLSLAVLTGVFFFQIPITRNERFVFWFRIGFLTFTLFGIGWYANAQLSIVNIFALTHAGIHGFRWDTFLTDPLVFILWCSVAASLLFWGRGAYCGWLCPFGALQELTNRLAKLARIPQWTLPWGLHERMWPLKYMIFLALFGLSLYSIDDAERFAEIEPFKTAIILKFVRDWPYVVFALALIAIGLFVERFYCRYLCPLGAALAI
ncbi:MAG: 4Fe-4S binding protein, partial [Hyphomicrobiales bacterium]